MTLENNSNIVVMKQDGTIARKLMYTPDLKHEIEKLVKEGSTVEVYNPLTFGADVGHNRKHFDNDGRKYSNKELLQKGLLTIEDDKKIDEFDAIVDMSELELFKKKPLDYPLKKIATDESGAEYLREKTDLERYDDNIITKDEYNSKMDVMRREAYSRETDTLKNVLMYDEGLSEDEKAAIELEITSKKEAVKKEFPKV